MVHKICCLYEMKLDLQTRRQVVTYIFVAHYFVTDIRFAKRLSLLSIFNLNQPISGFRWLSDVYRGYKKVFWCFQELLKGIIGQKCVNSFNWLRVSFSLYFMVDINEVLLILVNTCLGGRFGINCPSAFLKILKLPE